MEYTTKTKSRQPRHFVYQARSREQWRATIQSANGSMPIGKAGEAWLRDLLDLAVRHDHLLSVWQSQFVDEMGERFEKYGRAMFLSGRQRAELGKIEARVRGMSR